MRKKQAGPRLAHGGAPRSSWAEDAACLDHDPELFFPVSSGVEHAEEALAVCRTCPVIKKCFEHAMREPTLSGVWGGTTWRQRRAALGLTWSDVNT